MRTIFSHTSKRSEVLLVPANGKRRQLRRPKRKKPQRLGASGASARVK
jgi:hypothetical protein